MCDSNFLQFNISELSEQYSTKIGYEYHLPTVTQVRVCYSSLLYLRVVYEMSMVSILNSYTIQKLNTTNECIVSVLGGISSTAHQVHVHLHVHTVHV